MPGGVGTGGVSPGGPGGRGSLHCRPSQVGRSHCPLGRAELGAESHCPLACREPEWTLGASHARSHCPLGRALFGALSHCPLAWREPPSHCPLAWRDRTPASHCPLAWREVDSHCPGGPDPLARVSHCPLSRWRARCIPFWLSSRDIVQIVCPPPSIPPNSRDGGRRSPGPGEGARVNDCSRPCAVVAADTGGMTGVLVLLLVER